MCADPMTFNPEDRELVMAVLAYRAEQSSRLTAAKDVAFPHHIGHTCEEIESVYRGSKLIAVSAICSCGHMLEIGLEYYGS